MARRMANGCLPTAVTPAEPGQLMRQFSQALRAVSRAAHKAASRAAMTDEWTDFVLDWWSAAARRSSLSVDTHSTRADVNWADQWRFDRPPTIPQRGVSHEFMLDLIGTNYPAYSNDFYTERYWDKVGKVQGTIVLALESEWGSAGSAPLNRALVLEDALKLVHVRAKLKVLCFGVEFEHQDRLIEDIQRLRVKGGDGTTPWLLFPVPWDVHPFDGIHLKVE